MKTKQKEQIAKFRDVYERQFGRVYKLALLLLGNVTDAEDAVQIVFARFWEKKPDFYDINHENAWFITVVRNQCKDMQRDYFRKNRTNIGNALEVQVEFFYPEDNDLWQAMQELPHKYRVILYLYYYEGYSVRELSGIFHRKESTLQTQLADGRKKLRKIMEINK
ncbi:MAG: RNA polymerase sigma factor [Lachnospiraceae bacterium]|nr:RNA polymerase sigma factor [Lachnospiraceae bacterium]